MITSQNNIGVCDNGPNVYVFSRSDIVEANDYTEDGERLHFTNHFVVAAVGDGYLFRHRDNFLQQFRSFPEVVELDELEAFVVARFEEEHPSADFLRSSPDWYEIDPVYGSAAYQREGTEAKIRASEIAEER